MSLTDVQGSATHKSHAKTKIDDLVKTLGSCDLQGTSLRLVR